MPSEPSSNGSSSSLRAGRKKRWSELSPQQRRTIAVGVFQLVLTTIALRDLRRRPVSAVRGPKSLWFVGCFVQPFGPITYLLVGRRKHAA